MPVPDFQTLMLPVLGEAAKGEATIKGSVHPIAAQFRLTSLDLEQTLPSGGLVIRNRIHWAKTYLLNAALLEQPRRGVFVATERGRAIAKSPPARIDVAYLRQFAEFLAFEARSRPGKSGPVDPPPPPPTKTPIEQINDAHAVITADLRGELLRAVFNAGAGFLEHLTRDLMQKMGYGGLLARPGSVVGGSHDGGIDVVVNEDALGLGVVCLQCKCYAADCAVGAPEVQAFSGALDGRGAKKGVFVTTSYFSEPAKRFVQHLGDKKIILMDGEELAARLIENNLGVETSWTIDIKRIDSDFFEREDGG